VNVRNWQLAAQKENPRWLNGKRGLCTADSWSVPLTRSPRNVLAYWA
jgi:hypothetical protein